MSDSSKRIKPTSVAAFMFLPQFSLCFRNFSHIIPIFVRTLAVMFEQAQLLPPNHPATQYGIAGVKKYGVRDILGEAWFTLRSTHPSPYQWGLFTSVVLMFALMIGALLTAITQFSTLFLSAAAAQVFDHPAGPSGMPSVPASPGGMMFDKSIPPNAGVNADFGIMILNRMLRQAAQGNGGPLQNGLRGLMYFYNTGILIIAGVLLFWAVLSIVVDTAKTGIVGGGRHNMVWAPIRIVFALGLLVPMGVNGFSSGQFIVMKFAEWGSNFGTRAWITYVQAVVLDTTLVASVDGQNPSSIVSQYVSMWLCKVAYNGQEWAATGNPITGPQYVLKTPGTGSLAFGKNMFAFTNAANGNLCGTVTYREGVSASTAVSVALGDFLGAAIKTFQDNVNTAYREQFIGPTNTPGTLDGPARDFACSFAALHSQLQPKNGVNPLLASGECTTVTACGANPATGVYPDAGCIDTMVANFSTAVNGVLNTEAAILGNIVSNATFMTNLTAQGWPAMGGWYNFISTLNNVLQNQSQSVVTLTGGTILTYKGDSLIANGTNEIVKKLDDWWLKTPNMATSSSGVVASAALNGQLVDLAAARDPVDATKVPTAATLTENLISNYKTAKGGNLFNMGLELIAGDRLSPFIFDVLDSRSLTTYPLAQLAKIGNTILAIGFSMMGMSGLMSGLLGASSNGLNMAAIGLVMSPLTHILGTLGTSVILAGMLLKFYVPILPFIRVAFAVLTWMISVFEAVVMVPIAALSHLTTEGEGLAGGARGAWILWLNVLLRPVLTVIGFVGALLVFNTFVVYFHVAFGHTVLYNALQDDGVGIFTMIVYTVIYVGIIYTAANSIFKMLDLIPNALMRWMGGAPDSSFDDHAVAGGLISAGSQNMGMMGRGMMDGAHGAGKNFANARAQAIARNTPKIGA